MNFQHPDLLSPTSEWRDWIRKQPAAKLDEYRAAVCQEQLKHKGGIQQALERIESVIRAEMVQRFASVVAMVPAALLTSVRDEEREHSADEILTDMQRNVMLSNQDVLIEALRYAFAHLPNRVIDHITAILNR